MGYWPYAKPQVRGHSADTPAECTARHGSIRGLPLSPGETPQAKEMSRQPWIAFP
jgi:hypothetical protein